MPTRPFTPVQVELPNGLWLESLFCPVCGHQVLEEDGFKPCPHLAFVFTDQTDEPEWVAPRWKRKATAFLRKWDDTLRAKTPPARPRPLRPI